MNDLRTTPSLAPAPRLSYNEPPVSPTPINAKPAAFQPAVPMVPRPQPVAPAPPPEPAPAPPQLAPPTIAAVPVPPPAPVPIQPPAPVPAEPPAPIPVEPPAPVAVAPPAPAPVPPAPAVDKSVAVFLHLSSGERLWVGRFPSEAQAVQRAEEIVRTLVRPEPGVWAKFGQRLIRPEAVVSIELANRRED